MQEEVEQRSVTLIISATKLTLRVLREAIRKYLDAQKQKNRAGFEQEVIPRGKQTVKELIGQGKGVTNIEVTDDNIKPFERIAKKYGLDFAIKKDSSQKPPKYLVFFKAPDTDAMTAAFKEFTDKAIKRSEKPSILAQLHKFQQLVLSRAPTKERNRTQEKSI
jgi:hypothetical protein